MNRIKENLSTVISAGTLQKGNTHILCANIPLEGGGEMSDGVKTTAITVLGLAIVASKAFAMIILPAVLFAAGATYLVLYLMP